MRNITRGLLAVFVSSLGYGALPIFGKLAFAEGIGVLPLLSWRFIIGSALVWTFVFATRRALPPPRRVVTLCLLGILYGAVSVSYMLGLTRLPASLATLIFFSYPALTVLLARIRGRERLTRLRILALLLATAGCSLTLGSGIGSADALGVALMGLAALCIASFIVQSHGTMSGLPPISSTAAMITASAAAITAAGLLTGGIGVPVAPRPLLIIAGIGFFSTAIPISAFLIGIQWIGPARAAIAATAEPAVALMLAALLLGERLSILQWAGGLLIVGAVIWLRLERRPDPVAAVVEDPDGAGLQPSR
ncbi:EamA family transporter [Candidatus Palauibacter sp.]|uniref:EamA family transporter n=1 Tax=Candidatus Palauibacter sp. TaxID=3101350 RepID=UPI003B5A2CE6